MPQQRLDQLQQGSLTMRNLCNATSSCSAGFYTSTAATTTEGLEGLSDSQPESDTAMQSSTSSQRSRKKKKIENRQFLSSIPKRSAIVGRQLESFHTKFSGYAKIAEWTDKQKREQLCWCLDDAASEYYTLLLETTKQQFY
ncbi:Hypothetical predicted protein [Mytilus galloprovincialis]|uniref:Uncharacterized protein n=1 Tax=Mytilus galloprovincialis TaxID=29158 RepID=A0A8B6DLV7_MYTGA|nr:Hypothetical predicted protein [Mytilus galloprovincialis]